MDDVEYLRNSIGVLAEIVLIFWNAVRDAGADEETAYVLTTIYLESLKEESE